MSRRPTLPNRAVEPIDAAAHWAQVWHDAWEARETEAIVALYAPDAVFSTQAFRVPYQGRDGVRSYVAQAFDEEREPRVWIGFPSAVDAPHDTE